MQSVYLFDPSSHLDQIKLNPTIGAALLDYHFLAISCFSPLHCYNCEDEERERERERERESIYVSFMSLLPLVSVFGGFFSTFNFVQRRIFSMIYYVYNCIFWISILLGVFY